MEEEIDLRPYFKAAITGWKWIISAGLLAAIVAFAISSLLPPTYQATALVVITETRQRIQFDPRIQTQEERQPLKAFPQLAVSDDLLQQIFTQLSLPEADLASVNALRSLLEARAGTDPSLIQLTASHRNAETAAQIANVWAETLVQWGNDIYRSSNDAQLRFFEQQLGEAQTVLGEAELALVQFQAENRSDILTNRLLALSTAQRQYLTSQRQLRGLLDDVAALSAQLAAQSGTAVTWGDQLTVLHLQLQAYGVPQEGGATSGLQFQIGADQPLTSSDRGELLAYLQELQLTLATRLQELDGRLLELEPEILTLQQENQALLAELHRLQRNVAVAEETYIALARKVDEERISSQKDVNSLRLASYAAAPESPVAPRRLIITLVAGFLGAMFMLAGITGRQWWLTADR